MRVLARSGLTAYGDNVLPGDEESLERLVTAVKFDDRAKLSLGNLAVSSTTVPGMAVRWTESSRPCCQKSMF